MGKALKDKTTDERVVQLIDIYLKFTSKLEKDMQIIQDQKMEIESLE